MFSQKKKSYGWIYATVILVIAILAVLILIGALSNQNKNEAETANRANLESEVEENANLEQNQDEKADVETNAEKKTDQQNFYQSYYLVKSDNNVIKIYFSDETGKITELEETKIVFETLSAQDQQKFREGMQIDSRDDLNKLIMDYES